MERSEYISRRKFMRYMAAGSAVFFSACTQLNTHFCYQYDPLDGRTLSSHESNCFSGNQIEADGNIYTLFPLFIDDLEPYKNKHGEVFDLSLGSFTAHPQRKDLVLATLPTPEKWEENGDYPLQIHPSFIQASTLIPHIRDQMLFQERMRQIRSEPVPHPHTQLASALDNELGYDPKPRTVGLGQAIKINTKRVKCFELAEMLSLCSGIFFHNRIDILYYNYYDRSRNTHNAHALNFKNQSGLKIIDVNNSQFHEATDLETYLSIQSRHRDISRDLYHLSIFAGPCLYE